MAFHDVKSCQRELFLRPYLTSVTGYILTSVSEGTCTMETSGQYALHQERCQNGGKAETGNARCGVMALIILSIGSVTSDPSSLSRFTV